MSCFCCLPTVEERRDHIRNYHLRGPFSRNSSGVVLDRLREVDSMPYLQGQESNYPQPDERRSGCCVGSIRDKCVTFYQSHDGRDKTNKAFINGIGCVLEILKSVTIGDETRSGLRKTKEAIFQARSVIGLYNIFAGGFCDVFDAIKKVAEIAQSFFSPKPFDSETLLTQKDWENIENNQRKHYVSKLEALRDGQRVPEISSNAIVEDYVEGRYPKTAGKILGFIQAFFRLVEKAAFFVCFGICHPIEFVDSCFSSLSESAKALGQQFGIFWATFHCSKWISHVCELGLNHLRNDALSKLAFTIAKFLEDSCDIVCDVLNLTGACPNNAIIAGLATISTAIGWGALWYDLKA